MRASYKHVGESEKAERTTEGILKDFLSTMIHFFPHHRRRRRRFPVYCMKRDLSTNEREKGDVKLQGIILNFILPFSFLLFFIIKSNIKESKKMLKLMGFFILSFSPSSSAFTLATDLRQMVLMIVR